MMTDCLERAHPFFKFDEVIYQPEMYTQLTDSYVQTMIEDSDEECLKSANEILDKIKRRDIY